MAEEVKAKLVDFLETATRYTLQWISKNDQQLGDAVYAFHIVGGVVTVTLYVVSRIFYPAIWFQCFVYGFVLIVWIQHIFLNTCILTSLEKRLSGKKTKTSMDWILSLFGIPVQRDTRRGVTLLLSTVTLFMLTIEMAGRAALHWNVQSWI